MVEIMAKAISPVRLQDDLMQAAKLTGERFHRSSAEQIEYWADIGRKVSTVLDPDVLMSVAMGLSQVKVEPVFGQKINPDTVFKTLEDQRESGVLTQLVTGSVIKYQASSKYLGYLEEIDQKGNVRVGKFSEGEFIVIDELAL